MAEILFVTGEASGDVHGAHLAKELKKQDCTHTFTAVGSSQLEAQGAKIIFDIKNYSVMGLVEVVKKLPTILNLFRTIRLHIKKRRPDLVILIDNPDFNLRLAKKIKRFDPTIKIVYYISPSIWAWRYNRVKTIKKYVDKMLVILPFEEELYKKENIPCTFTGNPIIEEISKFLPNAPKRHSLNKSNPKIAIMPGSRSFEVKLLSEPIQGACKLIKQKYPDATFSIVKASTINHETLKNMFSEIECTIKEDKDRQIIKQADVAIIKSGTSTLEVGLLGTPMVIVYKFAYLTYFIAKYILRIRKQLFGLVNILLGKMIAKELFQHEVTDKLIFQEVDKLLSNTNYYNDMSDQLFDLQRKLKPVGISVSNEIMEIM